MEDQQTLLLKLLNDFELCLGRIKSIFDKEQEVNTHENNDDEWIDIDEEEETLKTCIPKEIERIESQSKVRMYTVIIRILVFLAKNIWLIDYSGKRYFGKKCQ